MVNLPRNGHALDFFDSFLGGVNAAIKRYDSRTQLGGVSDKASGLSTIDTQSGGV